MYKRILVNQSIEDGEKLIRKLEARKFPISAALWHYLEDEMLWRLIIVSPMVDLQGPLRSYMGITSALDELERSVQLTISDISVISPAWRQFQDLRRTIENAGVGRVSGNDQPLSSQGIVFEDFYIYRWVPDGIQS